MVAAEQIELRSDVTEAAVALVSVEKVLPVAGNKQVKQAIVVEVDHSWPAAAVVRRSTSLIHLQITGDIHEFATVVTEQSIERSILICRETIEPPVLVIVEPNGSDGFAGIANAHLLTYFNEALALIVEQQVRRIAERHKQIEFAIIVKVDPRHLSYLTLHLDAEISCDIDKLTVTKVVVEL